ncbi:MAG: hypothetical protein H6822_02470 [Planctomycetaceae bacterium]|nr:hypothetical protein [Planctomycetales bacterium]MCB9921015.1 hypothetical protein [Planctomycetaceae bacterium]
MGHSLRMLLGCLLPFLLIFVLPLFGVGEGVTLAVFMILMFGCHLFMMGAHDHRSHARNTRDEQGDDDAHT